MDHAILVRLNAQQRLFKGLISELETPNKVTILTDSQIKRF